ncbi:MAG: hypothetical protein SGPRY_006644 [Prymnesium sp.]
MHSSSPQANRRLEKPDGIVRCPISNQPLRLKQLIPITFTPAEKGASSADLVGREAKERYICPLTKKPLSNIYPATDMLDPFTDPPTKLKEKDIIPLRVEGTGFAAKTEEKQLKVTKAKPVGHF